MNKNNKKKFVSIFSYFTKIPERKIVDYLETHTIASLVEHPQSLDITNPQLERINMISDIYKYCERNKAIKDFNIGDMNTVAQYMRSYFPNLYNKEHLIATFLDDNYGILGTKLISTGTLNASIVHPRDVFREAIAHKSSNIILSHNHPSGSLSPSNEDINITLRIQKVGEALGINLIDHVIVNHSKDFHSFRDNGTISFDIASRVAEKEDLTSYEKREYKETLDNKVNLLNKITKIPKMKLKHLVEDSIHNLDKIFDDPSNYNLSEKEVNLIKALDILRNESGYQQNIYHNYKFKINSPDSILDYMKDNFDLDKDMTTVSFLNTKNEIIHCTAVNRNIPVERNMTSLIKDAINYSSNSIILFQKNNEQAGINPNLVLISDKVKDICNLIGIKFLDCVYLDKIDKMYSFKIEGFLDNSSKTSKRTLEEISEYVKKESPQQANHRKKRLNSTLEL